MEKNNPGIQFVFVQGPGTIGITGLPHLLHFPLKPVTLREQIPGRVHFVLQLRLGRYMVLIYTMDTIQTDIHTDRHPSIHPYITTIYKLKPETKRNQKRKRKKNR